MVEERSSGKSTRSRWIVIGVVVAAAGLAGAMLYMRSDPCRTWQDDMTSARAEAVSIFEEIEDSTDNDPAEQDELAERAIANGAKIKALVRDQPEGCDAPD